jgi:hypothetical protein
VSRIIGAQLVLVVVLLVAVFAPAALLQDHDAEARGRELLGHDAAGGSGADHDEVDLLLRRELPHGDHGWPPVACGLATGSAS